MIGRLDSSRHLVIVRMTFDRSSLVKELANALVVLRNYDRRLGRTDLCVAAGPEETAGR
jgi:hypothetical protein